MLNILVADDERIARDGIVGLIQKIYPKAEIFSCARSDEAIEWAKSRSCQIAFLDIQACLRLDDAGIFLANRALAVCNDDIFFG